MQLAEAIREFLGRVRLARKVEAIDSPAAFSRFLGNKAAFVSQKKLYEYVKTRMGLTYPEHFKDDVFIASLNIAKWRVYAACLSDLAVWMAANLAATGVAHDDAKAVALHCHERVVLDRFDAAEMHGDINEILTAFADRLALADLAALAEGETAFSLSPKELVRWAPISDKLKRYDTEIVINSLRFAWMAIREDFRKAFNANAVMEKWRVGERV